MRVLLIKTSSMGDIIHTLPALTDAGQMIPTIQFDWVVEDSLTEIVHWHPLVKEVIPVALRRWRKGIFSQTTRTEWKALRRSLRKQHYDLILDAQGLVKSACLTVFAQGKRAGLDWRSARESLASLVYQRKYTVNFYQHAIVRMRQLFSQALGYPLPDTLPRFGIDPQLFRQLSPPEPYLVFLHGTTWATKQWPASYWIALAKQAQLAGLRVKISGGNAEEIERAERIASASDGMVEVIPCPTIAAMARLLANAICVVAVDTGFGHLAAAFNVPTVSLYGSTNPTYTGAVGQTSFHLTADFPCSPCLSRRCTYKAPSPVMPACFEALTPERVWEAVKPYLSALTVEMEKIN